MLGILKELPIVKTIATVWENREHIKSPLDFAKVLAQGLSKDWLGQIALYLIPGGQPFALALTAMSVGDMVGIFKTDSQRAQDKAKELEEHAPQPA